MKIKLTKEQQEKLHSVGLVNVGKQVEVEEPVFNKNYAEWKKTLPLAGHSTLTLKAISTCLWTKRSGEHRKDFVLPQPKQEVKVQAKFPRWELRVIIGLLVLILGWLIFALPARAQFSQIVFIEWRDGGSAVTDGFFTFPFAIDCTTNVTCTSDGSTLTLSASAGSGGRWDQLTAPTGAMSLVSNADAEIMTWDFQSNFSTDRFVLKQTTGNPTGGALLLVSATDADVLLAQFGTTNGVQITQAGVLSAIGAGGITATLGDSATSFFSSGTLEVGIGGTGAGAFTLGSVVFAGASGVYTQDNSNLFWNDTANRLGIGTNAPSYTVHLKGSGVDVVGLKIENTAVGGKTWGLSPGVPLVTQGGFSIYNFTDSRADLRIDPDGNVGIGTAAPDTLLHLEAVGATALTLTAGAASIAQIQFGDAADTNAGRIDFDNSDNSLNFLTTDTRHMKILDSGDIGIGIDTPDALLHVHLGSAGAVGARAAGDDFVIENSTNAGMSILSPDTSTSTIIFGSPSDPLGADIKWNHDGNVFIIGSRKLTATLRLVSGGGVTALEIDGDQNFDFQAGNLTTTGTVQGVTQAEFDTLTNDLMADALHRHSELSASDGSPDAVVQMTVTGQEMIFSQSLAMRTNTSQGTDNQFIKIAGGGGLTDVRGAIIVLGGNQEATFPGHLVLNPGNVANAQVQIDSTIFTDAGRVSIGTASPATSALLELSSTTGALLPTRMTTTQRNALTAVDGMVLYNSTDAQLQGRIAAAWVDLGAGAGGGAPTDATYITQTSNAGLSAEQALDALASGIMRVDTAAGVITSLTDSAGIAANISDERGTGVMQFSGQTFEISILDSDAVPDPATSNVWSEPFTIAATNDNWARLVWVFTDTGSARNCLHGGFLVPNDYDTGGTASFNVVWSSPVLTNDVEWDLDYRGIGGNDTESFDQATAVESLNANDVAPSAAWERLEIALGITEANLAPGDDVEFLLCRDMSDAGDTLVGDAYLFRLIFSYTN